MYKKLLFIKKLPIFVLKFKQKNDILRKIECLSILKLLQPNNHERGTASERFIEKS